MEDISLKTHLKLFFCIFSICYAQLLIGCSYVFSSTLLAQLRQPTSTIHLSSEEGSWIASVSVLVCPIGLIVTGILTDKIGRKRAIQIIYIPMIISWLILAFAKSYIHIMIARTILGFPFGSSTCEYLYIAEISPVGLRPVYLSTVTLFVGVGMLTEWTLAVFFEWNVISGILCGMSVVGFVMVCIVPETPMWLRSQGRVREADEIDEWFVGKRNTVRTEGSSAITAVGGRGDGDLDDAAADREKPSSYWSLYSRPTVWKPTLITSAFLFLQQWSGIYVLLFYSVDVLRDCRVAADGVTVSVFLSGARVLGGIAFTLMQLLGRRTLMVVSGASTAASLAVIVAYTKIFQTVDEPPFGSILVLAFVLYVFFNLLGILPLPWMLCGEVFPMAVKGVMNGAVQTFGYFIMFVVIKVYPWMVLSFGVETVWSIFATCCVINALFGVLIMPETRGKSLDEILSTFDTRKTI